MELWRGGFGSRGKGESAFNQDEYEDAMMRFDELGVKLSIV